MIRNATDKTAEYKGRRYHVAWVGETKFGRRAKLQFLDRSKEFWVAATDVRFAPTLDMTAPPRHNGTGPRAWNRDYGRSTCWACHGRHDGGTICPECGEED